MGFKIDFKISKEYIDFDPCTQKELFYEKLHVSGNGCSDEVCITQEGNTICMSTSQFKELIENCLESSLFYEFKKNLAEGWTDD